MVAVYFTDSRGKKIRADAKAQDNLLRLAQAHGLPLEGTCEGQMACSTCHVIVDKEWFDRLPEASEEEEDMLDFAAGVQRTSRLSCQIDLIEALDGLCVSVPTDAHDVRKM